MHITDFISEMPMYFEMKIQWPPWQLTDALKEIIEGIIPHLGTEFVIADGIAVHKTAIIESGVTIKRPFIAMEHCSIAANAYFREGVFLDKSVKVGPCSEIKTSIICSNTALAHLNYIGNSIIGQNVNFEAGSIAANHFNEREDKEIYIYYNDLKINTGVEKFGSLIGDGCKIGANAVLSPGTVLKKNSRVGRLQLIDQSR